MKKLILAVLGIVMLSTSSIAAETKTSTLLSHSDCKKVLSELIPKYTDAGFDCVGMEKNDGDVICFRDDFSVGMICNGATFEITKLSNENLEVAAKKLNIH